MIWAFLVSRFARLAALAGVILSVIGVIYAKGRTDARRILENRAARDAAQRTTKALNAGRRAVRSGGRLREPDENRRDD